MKKLLILAVVVFALAAGWKELSRGGRMPFAEAPMFVNDLPKDSPLYAQQQEYIDRMNADPALRERFSGDHGTFAEFTTALKRGAQSLDGPSLVKFTKAMSAMIPRLPQHSCAQLTRGAGAADAQLSRDIDAAIARLPKAHHRNMMEFYVRALQAEVADAPVLPRNAENENNAMRLLFSKFNGPFAQRLMGVMSNPAAASDEDACWAINTLTHTVTQLDPQSAEAISRVMWTE